MNYPGTRSPIVRGIVIVATVLLVILLAAWSLERSRPSGVTGSNIDERSIAFDETGFASSISPINEITAGETAADVEQRIIKTGDIGMTADDVDATVDAITKAAINAQGFIQYSSVEEDYVGNRVGNVTVRVPVSAFEATLAAIKALGVRVERESTQGQDVTEQFTDLEARLRSAQAQEAQYLVILTDAVTVGDVLAVQEHLADVRMQIESLEGQIQYLENLTSYSTITVEVTQETRVTLPEEKFDLGREVRLAGQYVVVLGQRALAALIWLVIVGGAALVPLAALGFLGRALHRRFSK